MSNNFSYSQFNDTTHISSDKRGEREIVEQRSAFLMTLTISNRTQITPKLLLISHSIYFQFSEAFMKKNQSINSKSNTIVHHQVQCTRLDLSP